MGFIHTISYRMNKTHSELFRVIVDNSDPITTTTKRIKTTNKDSNSSNLLKPCLVNLVFSLFLIELNISK